MKNKKGYGYVAIGIETGIKIALFLALLAGFFFLAKTITPNIWGQILVVTILTIISWKIGLLKLIRP